MKITKKLPVYLPLEIGKTYKTKFATGQLFTVIRISKDTCWGFYVASPALGLCPLNSERLIPEYKTYTEVEVCSKCGEEI